MALTLTACGGSTLVTGGDDASVSRDGGDAAARDGGSIEDGDASVTSDAGGAAERCTADPQTDGVPCPYLGLACEYGADPDVACNRLVTCGDDQKWAVRLPRDTGCPSSAGIGAGCAATFASVPRGSTCTTEGLRCDYADGRCACGRPGGAVKPQPEWLCEDPGAGCPTPRPKVGAPCTSEGLACDYASCTISGGIALECTRGAWRQGSPICPP